ncbi:type II toxin-antitoxin system HigB family toxin [Acidisoma cellulosilytica]|uniref:Type II toxin-antitoxin system HigB family toxin n=1 Tax=Acidisoma cellulosilyticum TaxID=2802395 RepID=A0A963Z059_9PROT|nr:type II toxin-antitoxin system HigB family toxin [Acidisoma cellulosilyticum]MCB8880279.1 type II toxin-antitoxin system HigB family toxin [Acidisoma cellulosilyticum]
MQVIALRMLREFWHEHPRAELPLRAWHSLVSKADWSGPADIRRMFGAADFVGDNRVIFDIGGNKYRIVAHIAYRHHRVLIKFVGKHSDYDRINPETV